MDEVRRPHINAEGEFQSDKYEWCKPGFVPLKTSDPMAQDLLWIYAQRRGPVDKEFDADLRFALEGKGYKGIRVRVESRGLSAEDGTFIPWDTQGTVVGAKEFVVGFWRRREKRLIVRFDRGVRESGIEVNVRVAVLPDQVSFYVRPG